MHVCLFQLRFPVLCSVFSRRGEENSREMSQLQHSPHLYPPTPQKRARPGDINKFVDWDPNYPLCNPGTKGMFTSLQGSEDVTFTLYYVILLNILKKKDRLLHEHQRTWFLLKGEHAHRLNNLEQFKFKINKTPQRYKRPNCHLSQTSKGMN